MPPTLKIQFIKRPPQKRALLRCVRSDGSDTLAEMNVGAEHDLAHFAVETTLGLRRAFYGLLAGGLQIQDFNVQSATTKIDIPDEAAHVEFIVGLLQIERLNGATYEDFNDELRRAVAASRRPPDAPAPPINDEDLQVIRSMLDELMGQWLVLPADETLELEFAPDETS